VAPLRIRRSRAARPNDLDELAREIARQSHRLINPLGERRAIGVVGTSNNARVKWTASVEAMEIPAVECKNRSANCGRSRQHIGIRDSLVSSIVGCRRQHIMAERGEGIHE
jgi:hypothetical protein